MTLPIQTLRIFLTLGLGFCRNFSDDSDLSFEGFQTTIRGLPATYGINEGPLLGRSNPSLGYSFTKPDACDGDDTQSTVESGFDNVLCAIKNATNQILTNDTKNRFNDDSDDEASDIITGLASQFSRGIEDQAKTIKQSLNRTLDTLNNEIRINIANTSNAQREALIQLLNGVTAFTPELLTQVLGIVDLTNTNSVAVSSIVGPPVAEASEAMRGTIDADTKLRMSTLASLANSLKELLYDGDPYNNGFSSSLNREHVADELRRLIITVECIKQDILSETGKDQPISKINPDDGLLCQYTELCESNDPDLSSRYKYGMSAPAVRFSY